MALNTNKREGDKLHAEEWNELVQEVQGKQSRLNIVDALDSDSAVDVLSAKQGKMLKGMIDNATTNVNNVADVVKTLPVGYFYGTFSTEESLPIEITEKGYAYVGTGNPYIIYTFDADLGWTATENKYSTPALETDLSTGSEVKAPTTKAVKEGIESIDVTIERSDENELTEAQKYNSSANINDRVALSADVEGVSKLRSMGYKVLKAPVEGNSTTSFQEQVGELTNTVFEIKDYFDLNNTTVTLPANSTLKFNGGMLANGTIIFNNTAIEASDKKIFENLIISSSGSGWGSLNIAWLGAKQGLINYDNSVHLQDWYDNYSLVFKRVYFPQGTYYFHSAVTFTNNANKRFLEVDGNDSIFRYSLTDGDITEIHTFLTLNTENVTVKNVKIINSETLTSTRAEAFYINGAQRFNLTDITIDSFDYGVFLNNVWYGGFNGNNYIINCRGGVLISDAQECNNISFENLIIRDPCSIWQAAIRLVPTDDNAELFTFTDLSTVTIGTSNYLIDEQNTVTITSTNVLISDSSSFALFTKEIVDDNPVYTKITSGQRLYAVPAGTYYCGINYTSNYNTFYAVKGNEGFYFKSARVGIDIHTFMAGCKFYGISIESTDFGIRCNWQGNSSSTSRATSIINIDNCYFEDLKLYPIYIGKGWQWDNSETGYYGVYYTTGTITHCRFNCPNGRNIYLSYGNFKYLDNIVPWGVASMIITVVGDGIGIPTTLEYDANCTVNTTGLYCRVIKSTLYPNLLENTWQYADPQKVLYDRQQNNKEILPLTNFDNSSTNRASRMQTYRAGTIGRTSLVAIRDVIVPNPIIDGYVLKYSGTSWIRKAVDTVYAAVSQTIEGIDLRTFFNNYWLAGKKISNIKVQGLFPYEITADPSTGTVTRVSDNSVVGIGLKRDSNGVVQGINTTSVTNAKYYIFVDGLIAVFYSYSYIKFYCDIVQDGMTDRETIPFTPGMDGNNGYRLSITSTTSSLIYRTPRLNGIVFDTTENKMKIYNGYEWVEMIYPWSRYNYISQGKSRSLRMSRPELSGQTYYNAATGVLYTATIDTWSNSQNYTVSWCGSVGNISSIEHPNFYHATKNPVSYDTELLSGEMVRYDGKLLVWRGDHFNTLDDEPIALQVTASELLIGATLDSTATVNIYYPGTTPPTIQILNPDNTACTWLSGSPDPFTDNTLTLTVTSANTDASLRGAKVIVTLDDEEKTINITQAAASNS